MSDRMTAKAVLEIDAAVADWLSGDPRREYAAAEVFRACGGEWAIALLADARAARRALNDADSDLRRTVEIARERNATALRSEIETRGLREELDRLRKERDLYRKAASCAVCGDNRIDLVIREEDVICCACGTAEEEDRERGCY